MKKGKAILELAFHLIAARLAVQQYDEQWLLEEAARQKRNCEREAKRRKVQKRRRRLTDDVMERLREREEEG